MLPAALRPLALPLSVLYGGILAARAGFERLGLATPPRRLRSPVVSVGNLTVGGTGKTPAVIWIARALAARGRRVAVLSRGYGRAARGLRVAGAPGLATAAPFAEVGDEPLLLARLLPEARVVVAAARAEAGAYAEDRLGADLHLLDDGFQHRRLARDLDLLLLDASLDLATLRLLPAGALREPLAALGRAGLVLLTRVDRARDEAGLRALVARLAPGRPVLRSRMRPVAVRDLGPGTATAATAEPGSLRGVPILALSAIGRPEAFEADLRDLGADVRGALRFRDHHLYRTGDVARIAAATAAAGAATVVTTAKDAVRLEQRLPLPFPVRVLESELVPDEPEALLAAVLSAVAAREALAAGVAPATPPAPGSRPPRQGKR